MACEMIRGGTVGAVTFMAGAGGRMEEGSAGTWTIQGIWQMLCQGGGHCQVALLCCCCACAGPP